MGRTTTVILISLAIVGMVAALTGDSVYDVFSYRYEWVKPKEAFGTSPGTMTQLATSHVPTEEDARFYRQVYPGMVRREITELTGGDPGVVRPWIFPWYGRGVTLVV